MLPRGFKSWCEEVARQVRRELDVGPTDPLDPKQLAESLGVKIRTPADVPGLSADVARRLSTIHSDCWSAITVTEGDHVVVILNPAHRGGRVASNLAHELSHVLLGHEPGRLFMTPNAVLRTHDKDQELEASWLSGALLLPRDALFETMVKKLPAAEVCSRYGVSNDLLRFRLNATGVVRQYERRFGRR
jgi:hypothetical protein